MSWRFLEDFLMNSDAVEKLYVLRGIEKNERLWQPDL